MNETNLAYQTWYEKIVLFVKYLGPNSRDLKLSVIYNQLDEPSKTSLAITSFGFHKVILDWWTTGLNDIEQRNDQGNSFLILGSIGSFAPITQALSEMGADVNATAGFYDNALQAASLHRQ